MSRIEHRGGWVILASVVGAMVLSILPLPQWAEYLRPAWVPMVLIYWCMALPERVGVGLSWFVGLFQDVLHDDLLGQNALAFAVIAYLVLKLHQRVRVFPLGQQAFTVFMLIAAAQMLMLWVEGVIGYAPDMWLFLLPALTSAVLWPWIFLLMRELRRRFQVT